MSRLTVVLGIAGGIASWLYLMKIADRAAPAVAQTTTETAPVVPAVVPSRTPALPQPQQIAPAQTQPVQQPTPVPAVKETGPVPRPPGTARIAKIFSRDYTVADVIIEWDPVPGAINYQIYKDYKEHAIVSRVGSNSFSTGGLLQGSVYPIALKACNTNGCSELGPWIELKIPYGIQ